jgi:preprotein translocase subunit SecG
MKIVLVMLHVAVCLAMIMIILLQRGKGAGMGAAFGGSSQTVFGSAGATTFMHKVTTAAAIIFMLTSLGLSIFFGRTTSSSIMDNVKPTEVPAAESTQAPIAPAAEPSQAPAAPAAPADTGAAQ